MAFLETGCLATYLGARTIHEHPSCKVRYRLEHRGMVLLDFEAPNAAFEYEF
ncbi:MAG: hypothetical protein ACI3VZ_06125 [Faecousia sp.]